ncbi:MAG: pantoate--beta-alanine ligase [Planctomycetes bacterium]|nr:pantoate--beta-alanine ligase [Planctomycetota bacterium]
MQIIGADQRESEKTLSPSAGIVTELQKWRKSQDSDEVVGLVPTMGALHEGHLSLIRQARRECDVVALTIFVNPTQFAPGEDLDSYPRTLDSDLQLAQKEGVDLVWLGNAQDLYPTGFATRVEVPALSDRLCGKSRPHHFGGVCLIVLKLFQLFQPTKAFFGEKDLQQVTIIERMVADLHVETEIIRCPLVREGDGLALSSRNVRLTAEDRQRALSLSKALFAIEESWRGGERKVQTLVEGAFEALDPGLELEYLELVDRNDLSPIEGEEATGDVAVCIAARAGEVRLIDNITLEFLS